MYKMSKSRKKVEYVYVPEPGSSIVLHKTSGPEYTNIQPMYAADARHVARNINQKGEKYIWRKVNSEQYKKNKGAPPVVLTDEQKNWMLLPSQKTFGDGWLDYYNIKMPSLIEGYSKRSKGRVGAIKKEKKPKKTEKEIAAIRKKNLKKARAQRKKNLKAAKKAAKAAKATQ